MDWAYRAALAAAVMAAVMTAVMMAARLFDRRALGGCAVVRARLDGRQPVPGSVGV